MTAQNAQRTWKLVKEDGGIKVFQSPVQGSNYDDYKLETTLDATLAALVAVNSDVSYMPNWMDSMEANSLVSGDEQRYITHTKTKVPWPAKNRDAIVETWIEQNPQTLEVTMTFHSRDNIVPISKDYERVNLIEGTWTFTPQGAGKVRVVYQNHAEAGGKIPGWIANMFGVDVPLKSMKNMIKELKKDRYRNVKKAFIQEPV
ncbi:Conserved hypothetical protein [gamma proteobacterium HdN1]|nr:Conserved hypothetical protein [gamma proteobacterium HdN1]